MHEGEFNMKKTSSANMPQNDDGEKKSLRNSLERDIHLSRDELDAAIEFINQHKECKTVCQSTGNPKYSITFNETSINCYVIIKCEKCGATKNIDGEERSNI